MRRIIVNTGKMALVFYKGEYKRCLSQGTHWVWPWERVMYYALNARIVAPVDINILIKDEMLASYLELVQVYDNELALVYKDGNYEYFLPPGKYAFWKGWVDYRFVTIDLSKVEITEDVDMKVLKRSELVPYVRVCRVGPFERGLLYIDNKMDRFLDPGDYYFWKNETSVEVAKVDIRERQLESLGQEILTKDRATVRINFYISYRVVDIQKALIDNRDYEKQLYLKMQMVLRSYMGQYTLDELLINKSDIASYVHNVLEEDGGALGVVLSDSGIKDIVLPGDMRDIMNKVLCAEKKAQANGIMRREETAATRSLLNTAKLMEDNAMLYKLKEMEYVERIAEKISSISLSGSSQLVDQLTTIFSPKN